MIAPRRPFAMLMMLSVLTGLLLAMCGAPSAVPDDAPAAPPTATPAPEAEYVDVPAGNGAAAFRIGRTEVTNAQYAQCVAAGACTVPGTYDGGGCHYSNAAYAEHPVVCVTREQARAYAAWAGGRLLTDAEWTRACQGDDGRTYPWGSQPPDATLANYNSNENDTTAAGSYPAGASPFGALDMAGNVWEWIDDGNFVVRGGGFFDGKGTVGCSGLLEVGYDRGGSFVGFRVVTPNP
jgi:formylglycine-generating enzyme required for sulfatase activity